MIIGYVNNVINLIDFATSLAFFNQKNHPITKGHLTAIPLCPQIHYYPQSSSALRPFAIFAVLPRVFAVLRERVRWMISLAFA